MSMINTLWNIKVNRLLVQWSITECLFPLIRMCPNVDDDCIAHIIVIKKRPNEWDEQTQWIWTPLLCLYVNWNKETNIVIGSINKTWFLSILISVAKKQVSIFIHRFKFLDFSVNWEIKNKIYGSMIWLSKNN